MRSEAQRKADKAYANKLRRWELKFNREDADDKLLNDHLEAQADVTAYIKRLIEMDVKKNESE